MENGETNDFFFLFPADNVISYRLFTNAYSVNNYFLLLHFRQGQNLLSRIINKLHFICPCMFRQRLPYQRIRGKIVLLTNETLEWLSLRQIRMIKKVAKACVLFFIDEFFQTYASMKRAKKIFYRHRQLFDLVYTFSAADAVKQGINHTLAYYSRFQDVQPHPGEGVYFVGNAKNRGVLLERLYQYLHDNNIATHFRIPNSDLNFPSEKNYLVYPACIKEMLSSNVILDISSERQTGMTLRYYEAIVYNKKLLTNNENIVNMPYYNAQYMKIYHSLEDIKRIDYGWFTDNQGIDYGYKGEFEPVNFLKQIKENL